MIDTQKLSAYVEEYFNDLAKVDLVDLLDLGYILGETIIPLGPKNQPPTYYYCELRRIEDKRYSNVPLCALYDRTVQQAVIVPHPFKHFIKEPEVHYAQR